MSRTPEPASQVANGSIPEIAVSHSIDNRTVKNDRFEAGEDSLIAHLDDYLKDGISQITDSVWWPFRVKPTKHVKISIPEVAGTTPQSNHNAM